MLKIFKIFCINFGISLSYIFTKFNTFYQKYLAQIPNLRNVGYKSPIEKRISKNQSVCTFHLTSYKLEC